MPEQDAILERLQDLITWYQRKSLANRRTFKLIKVVEIAFAILIPFLAIISWQYSSWVMGGLGVAVVVSETLSYLNQYQEKWIVYRSTCESLNHEKYLYLDRADQYRGAEDPRALLAERIESLVSQKHSRWASVQPIRMTGAPRGGKSALLQRCNNGHYYDAKKHTKCPHCGVASIEFTDPRPKKVGPQVLDEYTRPTAPPIDVRSKGGGESAPTKPAPSPAGAGTHGFSFYIHTPGGESHLVEAPRDIKVEDLIGELVGVLNAQVDEVSWTVIDSDTDKILDPASTLAESGVRSGHNLYLRPCSVANGGMLPPSSPETSPVQFSVHYPLSVAPNVWCTLLTYAHLPEELRAVQAQTDLRVGRQAASSYLRVRGLATRDISRGAEITVVPDLPGCVVNPIHSKFQWLEDWHCAEFRFRSESRDEASDLIAGHISFYVGPILVCDIATFIQFLPQGEGGLRESRTTTTSDPYQAIFVSYSHQDSEIVEQLEKAYVVLGMQYLRDVRILRSGEQWNPALLTKIEQADIFQLCWSDAAKQSKYVTQEWKHALRLNRQSFVRPIYWQNPMADPPPPLADIHFAFLDLKT